MYSTMWKTAINEACNVTADHVGAQYWVADVLNQAPSNFEHLNGYTTAMIREQVNDAVERGMLRQGGEAVAKCQAALSTVEYRLAHSPEELFRGRYIRWISEPETTKAKLSGGGFFCSQQSSPKGVQITWISADRRRAGCVLFNKNIVFQTLTQTEKLCLALHDQSECVGNLESSDDDASDSD